MAKFLIVFATCVALVHATAESGEQNDSLERLTKELQRSKRGGIPHGSYGVAAGGVRTPAAVLTGSSKRVGGYSGGAIYGGQTSGLYSYGARGANAALYGGVHGPSTNVISSALAGRQLYAGHGGLIPAAIQSRRQIQFYDVPSNREDAEAITVEVGTSPAALLNIKFRSSSSPIAVDQDHESTPGSVRETSSEDEPHRLIHTVTRPIFQEVHEVIKPFRKVTQEIQPVSEDIQTIVAKGDEIVSSHGIGTLRDGGEQYLAGGYHGGVTGGSIVSKPIGASYGAGHAYSSGYSKPVAGYGSAVVGGARHHGGLEQVQVPFARRAAAAARRAARA